MVVDRSAAPILVVLCMLSMGAHALEPKAVSQDAVLYGEIPITTKAPAAIPLLRAGRLKALNYELVAASELLRKALALDPGFVTALAWLGKCVSGAEGLVHLEKAMALAKELPEPERLSIEALLAERQGDG